MNRKHLLYVENIPPSSSENDLIKYLEKWAPVQQVYFLREKQCTKRSIAAFVRVANEADLNLLLLENQQIYRGKRLFMVRVDQTLFFQADQTVIVRNITTKISEENLYDHFNDCGKIEFLQIRTNDFAYIGFEDKSSVRNAMAKNNIPLKGSNLKIQLLTRNIEIMIVNLDTLHSTIPELYRKMILPVEPRQPGEAQQQSKPPQQQQQSQPARQQQQHQPQRQQMSTIQLLEMKANAAGKQQPQNQPQQKRPQQASFVQPAKTARPVQNQPKKQDVATPVPVPVAAPAPDDVVPPLPSAYKPQPNDVMRPVKASEIAMSVAAVKNPKESLSVWVNNIPPETSRLTLVLYMEQFGDVESCKMSSSTKCFFTRWAKVSFSCEEAVKRATEYFLHPFQGRYLFVLACNRTIDEVPGKVFVLDYLSQYLVYEDVVKSFKHVGDVFYLVRMLDNACKVRVFFLTKVDEKAVFAVKSMGGTPINVEPYTVGMKLKIDKNVLAQLKQQREIMNPEIEARMAKIIKIYKEEEFDRCDPVVNPDGKTEGNEVVITNVHSSTTTEQINEFLHSIGTPTFARREKELYTDGYDRIYVGFRTLSMVLKATELLADMTLNGGKPFVFAAWTKPRMTERNTVNYHFDSRDITVQAVYDALIHFGKIRYAEKDNAKKIRVVWDRRDNGFQKCNVQTGFLVGPHRLLFIGKYSGLLKDNQKKRGFFNVECKRILMGRADKQAATQEKQQIHSVFAEVKKQVQAQETLITTLENLLRQERAKRGEKEPPAEVEQLPKEHPLVDTDDEDVVGPPNIQPQKQRRDRQQNQQQGRRGPPQQQQRSGQDRNRNPSTDNGSRQRRPHQQQQQNQRRPMNPWQGNQGPVWNDQPDQQQFQRQLEQFMPDDGFNRNNEGPFDMFNQGGRNMNQFDQMMLQQFDNFPMNQQSDNGFNCGPLDCDDPPLDGRWGQQQQDFNQSNSPFRRGFREDCDDDNLNFGQDSLDIPPNIPEELINEYIMQKEEVIKRRLEQLEMQLITSVEGSRNQDFGQAKRRRGNGSNPDAVARNRDRRGNGFGGGRGRGREGGRRDRAGNLINRF